MHRQIDGTGKPLHRGSLSAAVGLVGRLGGRDNASAKTAEGD